MKKALKVFLIFVITSGILLAAAVLIAPMFLNETIEETLIEEFKLQTGEDYTLDLSGVDLDILGQSITLDSVLIESSDANQQLQMVEAASISMNGIGWSSMLEQSLPEFREIVIESPRVRLKKRPVRASSFEDQSATETARDSTLSYFNLIIRDGAGSIVEDDGSEIFTASGIEMSAKKVDLNRIMDGSALLFLDDLDLSSGPMKWSLKDTFYELSSDSLHFDKSGQMLELSGMALTPTLPRYEYARARGRQIGRIQLDISGIQLSGINVDSLIHRRLTVDSLILTKPWMEVFRDKQLEQASDSDLEKPMLHEATKAIPIAFELNGARIQDGTIIYTEHKPPSDSAGSISFNQLNASLGPFRTASHPDFRKDPLQLQVDTQFMNEAHFQVQVLYPFYRTDNYHRVSAQLSRLDPQAVNNMLERVGFVRVESGMVHYLDTTFELNNVRSSGTVTVLYDSLKISMLNKKNPDRENVFQRAGNLLANTFLLKPNNEGDKPRVGEISYEKVEGKSIFAYWWQSLLSGLKDSIR